MLSTCPSWSKQHTTDSTVLGDHSSQIQAFSPLDSPQGCSFWCYDFDRMFANHKLHDAKHLVCFIFLLAIAPSMVQISNTHTHKCSHLGMLEQKAGSYKFIYLEGLTGEHTDGQVPYMYLCVLCEWGVCMPRRKPAGWMCQVEAARAAAHHAETQVQCHQDADCTSSSKTKNLKYWFH